MNRPGGAGNRPSSGDLGNFLGMPSQGAGAGIAQRPGGGRLGPGGGRPSQLPANRQGVGSGFMRPGGGPGGGVGNQVGVGDRGRIGDRGGIGDRSGVGDRSGIRQNRPARGDRVGWGNYRSNRASSVRDFSYNNVNFNRVATRPGGWWGGGYGGYGSYGRGFARGWTASNAYHGWGNFWGWHGYAPGYWWGVASSAAALTSWCVGLASSGSDTPVYYDYGDTVYIDNSTVYRDGQPLASEEEYAGQAMQYASVDVPAPPEMSDAAPSPDQDAAMQEFADNWMPLGIFAVARDDDDNSAPKYYLQLAVSKDGFIAGTCYDSINEQTRPVTGSVDKSSMRAAWKADDKPDVVMETGIFNLTQESAPALIHFGKERTESRLLVRMAQQPEGKSSPGAAS